MDAGSTISLYQVCLELGVENKYFGFLQSMAKRAVLDVKSYLEYLLNTTKILDDYAFSMEEFEADRSAIKFIDIGLATDGAKETEHRSMVLTFLRFVCGAINEKLHENDAAKLSPKEYQRHMDMNPNDRYWLGVQSHLNCVLVAYSCEEDTAETSHHLLDELYGTMEELFGGDKPFLYCERLNKYFAFRFAFPADHKAHQMHLGCGGASHMTWFFSPNNAVTCPERLMKRWRYCDDCMQKPVDRRKAEGCTHPHLITSVMEAEVAHSDPLILHPITSLDDDALETLANTRIYITSAELQAVRGKLKQAIQNYINVYDSMSYQDLADLADSRENERILDRILLSYKAVTHAVFKREDQKVSQGIAMSQLSRAWNQLVASGDLEAFQLLDPTDLSHMNKKKMLVMYLR